MTPSDPGVDSATGLPTPGNTAVVYFRAPVRPRVDEVSALLREYTPKPWEELAHGFL